jgi:4-amino-4-deoxy-L-arabinose transferase-like glycosyltransferase
MLDSLLTLTKGAVFWMLGAIVTLLLLDRAIAILTGLQLSLFFVLAVGVAGALLIAGTYTLAKRLRHHTHAPSH